MTDRTAAPGIDRACPWLGLANDPATHFSFPSAMQRCHAEARARTIEEAKQARHCLTAEHPACSRYRSPAPPPPIGAVTAAIVATAGAPGSGRSADSRPATTRPPVRRIVNRALLAMLLVAAGIGGIFLGSRLADQLGGRTGGADLTTAPEVSATPEAATAAPTPAPTPTPTPTAEPSPTPSPTPPPTPVPTPVVHVVERGETLSGIAVRYGVTVAAISEANGITDPNVIEVGQQLVIPAP